MKIDKFVLAIIMIIALAYFFPHLGSGESGVVLNWIGSLGISLIFFFYGLKLSTAQLLSGLKNWKLHLLVQGSTFLLFPTLVLIAYPFVEGESNETFWLAFLFLAALPSTVSSSVVMVSLAKGNVPAAIFNASISGLIGIAITPIWMGLFLNSTTSDFSLSDVYLKLLLQILLPVILGLFLQQYFGKYARKYATQLTLFDKSIILLIIYKSFVESFDQGLFTMVKAGDLLLICAGVILLFVIMYTATGFISKLLDFSKKDQITAQFCGTKKSLVHGTVFSKVLLPESLALGVMLLPLMLFHAFQILVISFIATRVARQGSDEI
jgi:sodium/bile acid cotransporter 7